MGFGSTADPEIDDGDFGYKIVCTACGGHLGHVFKGTSSSLSCPSLVLRTHRIADSFLVCESSGEGLGNPYVFTRVLLAS